MSAKTFFTTIFLTILGILIFFSCVEEKNLYKGGDDGDEEPDPVYKPYLYPYEQENTTDISAEIIIELNGVTNLENVETEIPLLKYNKSWLCMITQDDCPPSAFSATWAAINGRPLSNPDVYEYYYNFAHLMAEDMPPATYSLNKTLGFTDGTGNEIRFAPTVTLAPEEDMDAEVNINKGYTSNYYRFYKKSLLIWDDLIEMLNYGFGISFHDVSTPSIEDPASILEHLKIAQDITLDHLSGRGIKTLAKPNNYSAYLTAGEMYDDIQIMTNQNGGEKLFPFDLEGKSLYKKTLERYYYATNDENTDVALIKNNIINEQNKDKNTREATHILAHTTVSKDWKGLLLWLNDNYGKDGDDSVWFPSLEEYYEYIQNRLNGRIEKKLDGNKLILSVYIPGGTYFYFPSLTINVSGIESSNIQSVTSNDVVTGMSYGEYGDGIMVNIDCKRFAVDRATRYVERYEARKNDDSMKSDAVYFVSLLKESETKDLLLERLK